MLKSCVAKNQPVVDIPNVTYEQIVVSHNNSVCLGLEVPVPGCNLETNNWLVAPAMGPGVLGTWHRLP